MKVTTFSALDTTDLDSKVNSWLAENQQTIKVINISNSVGEGKFYCTVNYEPKISLLFD